MARRLRLSVVLVVAAFATAHLLTAQQVTPWDPTLALRPIAAMLAVITAVGVAAFTRRRSSGWTIAWIAAGTAIAMRALGAGWLSHLERTADGGQALLLGGTPDTVLGTALYAAGAGGLVGARWLMIRERLEITFATDFLAEGLLIGTALAYLFAVSTMAMRTVGDEVVLTAVDVVGLLPLTFSVAAWWLMTRLTRLTSEAPGAYRWLTMALLVLVLPAMLYATTPLVRAGGNAWAVTSMPLLETLGMVIWAAASLDPSLARPFDPVPVPDRAAVAHVPMLIVLMALGPLLAALAVVAMAAPGTFGTQAMALNVPLLLFGALLFPLVTGLQLIRRVHIEYSAVSRDQHDSLTGLADAAAFRLAVAEAIDKPKSGTAPAVLYLDLDRFKAINDSLGHDVGDELLRNVAKRLSRTVPPKALPGRLGGDEFAVLLPDCTHVREAEQLADQIIEAFRDRHRIENRDLFVGTSVGIALGSRGMDAETVIKHADVAMYRAKRRRDHKRVTYSSELDTQARLRLSLESELRSAVDRNLFTLYYQPKVDAGSHRVVGYEALLRWRHPNLGILPPGAFLPIAEETGLVRAIGDWVLLEACRVLRAWQSAGRRVHPIAVNISPRQIAGTDLYTLVANALERTGADPHFLEIELTESTLLEDLEGVSASVARLRELGVTVSLDDFGTGYSALSYLQRIRFDWIKLDRTFVSTITEQDAPEPVVNAVLALAQQLGTPVVAEGVETQAQAEWLASHGAHVLQGYLFGRPEPLAAWDALADDRPPRDADPRKLLAIGLDVHRMRRILAAIAVDASPDATQQELTLLSEALETGGRLGFGRRRQGRTPPREGLRTRRSPLPPTSPGGIQPVPEAVPLTPGQIARGPVHRREVPDAAAGPLDLAGPRVDGDRGGDTLAG